MSPVPSGPISVIDGVLDTSFTLALNQNTAILGINLVPGQTYTLVFTQDGAGGHQVVFMSSFRNPPAVSEAPSARTIANFVGLDDGNAYSSMSASYS